MAASGTPEAPSLTLESWVRVVHQESVQAVNHWRRRNYAVDFVHRAYLARYITEDALPFAEALARRAEDYYRKQMKKPAVRPENLSWVEFLEP